MYQAKRKPGATLTDDLWQGAYTPNPLGSPQFLREFNPTLFEPFKMCQGREDIDHSLHYDFEAGLIKGEWCPINIQTREWAPWERA